MTDFSSESAQLVDCIKVLHAKRYTREALLVRLVSEGVRLADACSLTYAQIERSHGRTAIVMPDVDRPGEFAVAACLYRSQGPTLHEQVAQNASDLDVSIWKVDADCPLFPSRKGGTPITTRSAQRYLKEACRSEAIEYSITFKTAARVGREIRKRFAAATQELEHLVAGQVAHMKKLVARMFPKSESERDEASQNLAMDLCQEMDASTWNSEAAYAVSVKSLRRTKSCVIAARAEASGVFDDWSWVCASERTEDSQMASHEKEQRAALLESLDCLTWQERKVLITRYGLRDEIWGIFDCGSTYREIGSLLGCSPTRVKDIEENALKKLRRPERLFNNRVRQAV